MAKKKKVSSAKKQDVEGIPCNAIYTNANVNTSHNQQQPLFAFKSKSYQDKKLQKKKISKGLKQIIVQEKALGIPAETVQYFNVDAPPSFRPSKKYSDLSGFQSLYTDPQSNLRYCLAEEYHTIQTLPGDIISGYLALRKAFNPV